MLSKMGTEIWRTELPQGINNNGDLTMVAGADVFHKPRKPSVVSVVSTINKNMNKFYSQMSVQQRKSDDTLYELSDCIRKASQKFMAVNKAPAKNIIVFRDGVGES